MSPRTGPDRSICRADICSVVPLAVEKGETPARGERKRSSLTPLALALIQGTKQPLRGAIRNRMGTAVTSSMRGLVGEKL